MKPVALFIFAILATFVSAGSPGDDCGTTPIVEHPTVEDLSPHTAWQCYYCLARALVLLPYECVVNAIILLWDAIENITIKLITQTSLVDCIYAHAH